MATEYNLIKTGSEAVDAVGMINITGNVTPENWYKWIRRHNGRPHHFAITLLAEIVYWYRPKEIRDEKTGTVRGYEKKFKGEWLQKDYADLTEKFGEEQHTIRRALECLEELGVIKKHLCTVLIENKKTDDKNAKKCNNVLFIELCPDVLKQITFSLPDGNESEPQNNVSKYDEKEEEKELTNLSITSEIMPEEEQICKEPVDKFVETNTKTDKENYINNISTTHEEIPVVDDAKKLFAGLGLSDKDIGTIVHESGDDLSRCRQAVEVLKKQKGLIENVVGWLIKAVREGYVIPRSYRGLPCWNSGAICQREYDYEALEKQLVKNW